MTDTHEKPMLSQATEMMLDAMRQVRNKTMDPKDASAIAQLGIGVINAANAETSFIKIVRGLPRGGIFGDHIQYLDPNVTKEQEKTIKARELSLLKEKKDDPCPFDTGDNL
jgi:hypothetical protein